LFLFCFFSIATNIIMATRTASCLCGSVKVAMNGDPFMTNLCHCSSCQKNTGAAFGSLASYNTDVRIFFSLFLFLFLYLALRHPGSPHLSTNSPLQYNVQRGRGGEGEGLDLHLDLDLDDFGEGREEGGLTIQTVKQQQVTFTEVEPSVLKTYEDTSPESGEVLRRSFCGKCGSPVRIQRKGNPERVALPVGIVDGDKSAFKPQIEFFCRGRADWVAPVEHSQTFETLPPKHPSAGT
jgi:hypothetical protein